MEKFLWNLAGCTLFAINVFSVMIAFVSNNKALAVAVLLLAALDWVYINKRPTWIGE